MRRLALAISLLSLVVANQSRAGLTPVAPFPGLYSETWESFPVTAPLEIYLPDPTVIMGGSASISHPSMFTYNIRDLGTSGYAVPSDGTILLGIDSIVHGPATITFTVPIDRFGAYWGAATTIVIGDPALIQVQFFDESDILIGTDVLSYSRPGDGVLEWQGWASDIPIKKIVYAEDYVVIDGLQANPVPEPVALALILPALLLSRRRRNSIPYIPAPLISLFRGSAEQGCRQ
jgi:hypothetical protein